MSHEHSASRRFWQTGAVETHPLTIADLYRKKFSITADDKIAVAGTCFARNITRYLHANGFYVLDKEPPPPYLDEENLKAFGYSVYSARFGDIPTVRQLAQLADDAFAGSVHANDMWMSAGRYRDALRPAAEPDGYESLDEAIANRKFHLQKVREVFEEMTVFMFTLGSTEAWVNSSNGRVYPCAPSDIADGAAMELHTCKNFTAGEVLEDFAHFQEVIGRYNPEFKIILTVSASPMLATSTDQHIIVANMHSKSVLREVAGHLADSHRNIDYFPAYELIASPWSRGFLYESDLSRVNAGGLAATMRVFFAEHTALNVATPEGPQPRDRKEKKLRRKQRREKAAAAKATPVAPAA